jgi:preprotein translocase subunit SecA
VDLLADKVRPWVTRLLEKAYADAARMGRNEGEETEGEEAASRALPSSETLTHLLYRYFGAKVELEDEIEDQTLCTEKATREVAASLIQQRERLLDLAYELVGKQVDTYCPPNQHFDEWDHSALEDAVYQVFDLFVDGLEWLANRKEIESAVKEIFKVSDSKVSLDRLESMVRDLSDRHMPPDLDPDEWDMKAVRKAVSSDLGIKDVHLEDLSSREAAEAELVEIVIDQNDPAKLRESIHKEVQKLASRVKQYGSGLLGADFNSWLNEQIDECCPAEDTPVSWELDALVDALRTRLNRPEDGLLHLSSSDEVVDRIYQGVERFVSLADQEDDAIIAQEAAKRFLNEHCPAWKLDTLVERLQERVGLTFDIEKEAERSKIFAQIHSQASQLLDAEQIRERILELAHEELVERLGVEIPDGAEDFLKGMTDRYLSPDQPVVDWDPEEMAKQVVMWAAGETDEQEVDLKAGRSLMAFVPVRGRHVTMERFLETIEEAVHKACPTERPASSWNLGGLADEVRKAFFVSVPGLTGELNHTTLKADCLERVTTDRHTVEQLVDEHCPADATVDEWDVAGLSEAAQHKGIDLSEALWKADHEQIRRRIHKALTEAATERAKWRHPERLPALIGDLLHRYCPTWDSASLTKELERRTKKTLPSADLESATDRDDLRSRLLSMLERVDWTGAKAEDAVDATLEQWTSQWNEPGLEHDLQHALGTKIDLSTTAKTSSPEELTKDIIQKHLVSQSEKTLTPWQEKTIEELASKHHHSTSRPTWDTDGLVDTLEEIFCERFEDVRRIDSFRELNKRVLGIALAYVAGWDKALGLERRLWVFRHLYLEEVDDQWIEHLKAMDHLREGIGLRGYGQRDPKLEYQREGFAMFEAMMQRIQENVASNVFRVRLEEEEDELPEFEHKRRQMQFLHMTAPGPGGQQPEQQQQPSRPKTVRRKVRKVGPNEECPCGSGRKYKKCHMRKDQAARRRGELPEWALAQQKQAASSSQKKKSARR